jgi:hypothetical protein
VASANLHTGELELLYALRSHLLPQDILLGDRGYGNYVLLALLQHLRLKVDFIGRSIRGADGRRRLRRLGRGDWLMLWQKGTSPSRWLPKALWQALLRQLTLGLHRSHHAQASGEREMEEPRCAYGIRAANSAVKFQQTSGQRSIASGRMLVFRQPQN